MAPPQEGHSTRRRDDLVAIQQAAQASWLEANLFEIDAPETGEGTPDEKFFGNFPYPYMNGVLHLGHAFSLSKLEFASAYHRLCGKRVLFPQGFHCTGMPIKACADKLNRELELYGCPPVFTQPADDSEASGPTQGDTSDPTVFKAGKSKAVAKAGVASTQYAILKMSGIPEEEIPSFRDPKHWLTYFPPLAQRDISAMGCGVDWRRSFITTDVNPYYDSFVQWQFWTLRSRGVIIKDKRYAVYSPLDGQPCADHDRASGEGVGPQEYVLVKMEVAALPAALEPLRGEGKVQFMAATLRPETMPGQTNCWVLPSGQYCAYRAEDGDVWIIGAHAARNLAFQEKLRGGPEASPLLEVTGQDLMGTPLKAYGCQWDVIYTLPLLTISMAKGTGVVTSVPSDSPDDYRALMDLKEKPALRAKFGVEDAWVLPFEPKPIIDIPGFGQLTAQAVCEQLKIQSQNEKQKLEEAKRLTYLKGFTDGVMLVGPYAGTKVSDAKPKMKVDMLDAGGGVLYCEPEKEVISRSGEACVVALTDQWYLQYGEQEWMETTKRCLDQLDTCQEETRHSFEATLDWLKQWACSRSFGLGTRLPWDPQYLIESLSDSTIYMAYYTVAHLLQSGDIYGQGDGPVKPEDLTPAVWDFIFLEADLPADTPIPEELLRRMKREFEYWYPFDMRTSGKDLIQNHLTFCLYNHTAIWPQKQWPGRIRCNGHLTLNSEKMSKSKGNFMTLEQACHEYGADALRVGLADAGDGLEDANFEEAVANASILRLTKEITWTGEVLAAADTMRSGDATTFPDREFENAINLATHHAKQAFDALRFRDVLKHAHFDALNARDQYRASCGPEGMNVTLLLRFIESHARMMAPVAPHTCEHIWQHLLKREGTVLTSGWPEAPEPDYVLEMACVYFEGLVSTTRKHIAKMEAPPKKPKPGQAVQLKKVSGVQLGVAARFEGIQAAVRSVLAGHFDSEARSFPEDIFKKVLQEIKDQPAAQGLSDKAVKQQAMPIAKRVVDKAVLSGASVLSETLPFDEVEVLRQNLDYMKRTLGLATVEVFSDTDGTMPAEVDMSGACPGQPGTHLVLEPTPDTME